MTTPMPASSRPSISGSGTDDTVMLNSWYGSTPTRIEAFETSTGQTMLATQVDALVAAMASFAPPAPGQTSFTSDQQTALAPLITVAWES